MGMSPVARYGLCPDCAELAFARSNVATLPRDVAGCAIVRFRSAIIRLPTGSFLVARGFDHPSGLYGRAVQSRGRFADTKEIHREGGAVGLPGAVLCLRNAGIPLER